MPQLESEARSIAEAFVAARRAGMALADYPGRPPQALGESYAVQDAAISLFGGTIAGWKVGRINPPWLEQLGTSRRTFYPNLQSIRGVKEGKTIRANVCVQCIRSGKILRPLKRKPFATPMV